MSVWFQIILIFVSIFTFAFILRNIRKSQMQIGDSIFWVFFSIILLLFSIFPKIAEMFSSALGIASAVNFIFLFIIFLLLINQFQLTLRISKLDTKFKELVQSIAIKEQEDEIEQ